MSKPKRMLASTVKKRLEEAEENYLDAIQGVADELRKRMVIPFCNKHNLKFTSGMGTFSFEDDQGRLVDPSPEELWDNEKGYHRHTGRYFLKTEYGGPKIPGSSGICKALNIGLNLHPTGLGAWIDDYTPPGFPQE
ncbi:MAG: hypothetical protein GF334_10300 [Candidatus Altiarchaeales archaeon]|nr:hypothetical protein [Candidatus Altiarchaeales archaeon]